MWILIGSPSESVAFVREQLPPVRLDPKRLRQWIEDLDSDRFTVREKATKELRTLEELALPALRRLVAKKPSLEVRRRAEEIMRQAEPDSPTKRQLLAVRAVEVLEYVGTPEARQLLDELARGESEARLTREAKAALARLTK
jgi:hypothetical protein